MSSQKENFTIRARDREKRIETAKRRRNRKIDEKIREKWKNCYRKGYGIALYSIADWKNCLALENKWLPWNQERKKKQKY